MNDPEIEKQILTQEEERAAIYEGKLKKFFHERTKDYWEEKEKPKKHEVRNDIRPDKGH